MFVAKYVSQVMTKVQKEFQDVRDELAAIAIGCASLPDKAVKPRPLGVDISR